MTVSAPSKRVMIDARAASYDQHRKDPRHGSKTRRLPPALNDWPLRMEPLPAWQQRAPPFLWKPDCRSNHVSIRTAAMCRSYWSSCSPVGFGGGGSPWLLGISLLNVVWPGVNGVGRPENTDLMMDVILNRHIDVCQVRSAAVKEGSA